MADLSTKMVAMCKLIATDQIAQGYNVPERADLEIKARVWIEVLDRGSVPAERYADLYRRASDARVRSMRDGKQLNLSAEFMLSLWEGPNGMRSEIASSAPRPMLESGECPHCLGTGWRQHVSRDGRYPGVRRCSHDG